MAAYIPLIVNFTVKVVLVLVALWLAMKVSAWLDARISRTLEERKVDATLARFLGKIVRYGVFVMALLSCLGVFGINTTSFAALIGGVGLAIGLAMQGSLANVSAGVMLVALRPFKVDDVIKAAGQVGKVNQIGLLTTQLTTPDNREIIIPNAAVFGATIEVVTHHDTRRVDIPVGVDYSADVDTTRSVLRAAVTGLTGVLDTPETTVVLTGLAASSVDWQVRVWCKTGDYFAVLEGGTRAIKLALDEAGIGIPYQTLDVHVRQGA